MLYLDYRDPYVYHCAAVIKMFVCPWRFHKPAKEPALNHDVVLPVDDDVQLSVVQYRNKLYEVQKMSRKWKLITQWHYHTD